ncbi:MAG: phenylalanine 4-monooxygenase [Alphaproteobacteria bacterium]|nr:phenylalanine 4-monooxygenase [Alphaproteobacteria bacterium]
MSMNGLEAFRTTTNAPLSAGAYPGDVVVEQPYQLYGVAEQQTWQTLWRRQSALMPGRACEAFLAGLKQLDLGERIPRFSELSKKLKARTGFEIVAVNGLCSDRIFFEHLANRRFPVTWWIRSPEQLDYLEEPDLFHDTFGHVPLLADPVFADYMQAYGEGGLKALRVGGQQALSQLARLYWYTVEFGLIREQGQLRIYGAGIVSSKAETLYSLESTTPKRLGFDLPRIMRTQYKIDDFQRCYFVIDGFDQLFDATRPDFTPLYEKLKTLPEIDADAIVAGDRLINGRE